MTEQIASEIQAQQNHGRAKYGDGPDDLAHDDGHIDWDWFKFIRNHNMDSISAGKCRRDELIKVAGLAVSAIEVIDRRSPPSPAMSSATKAQPEEVASEECKVCGRMVPPVRGGKCIYCKQLRSGI